MILAHENEIAAGVETFVQERLPEIEGGAHDCGLGGIADVALDSVFAALTH